VGSVNDQSVHEWKIYCIDKNTGKTLWDRTSYKGVPQI
jgi:outer membrane protein assembly factor BamB